MTRYRVGRHNNRIVYAQKYMSGPADDDEMVAVFFDAEAARWFVHIGNSVLGHQPGGNSLKY